MGLQQMEEPVTGEDDHHRQVNGEQEQQGEDHAEGDPAQPAGVFLFSKSPNRCVICQPYSTHGANEQCPPCLKRHQFFVYLPHGRDAANSDDPDDCNGNDGVHTEGKGAGVEFNSTILQKKFGLSLEAIGRAATRACQPH